MKKIYFCGVVALSALICILAGCASTPPVSTEIIETLECDYVGNTPLMQYVSSNRDYYVDLELDKDIYFRENNKWLNHINIEGNNALHLAVENQSIHIVTSIVKTGIESNVLNKKGFAPLHLAILNNDKDVVLTLLKHGKRIIIDVSDASGASPLILAAREGFVDIVELLLEEGANPDKMDNNKKTYKDYLSLSKISQKELPAEPTLGTKYENKIFVAPVEETLGVIELNPNEYEVIFGSVSNDCNLIRTVLAQDYSAVSRIVSRKVDNRDILALALNERDACGNSALIYALTLENQSIVDALILASREWINVPNSYGQSPLMVAIASTDHMYVARVLENSPNVNVRDIAGNTPLSLLVMQRDVALAKKLIQKGARTSFKYKNGNNILQQAVINNDFEMVNMILQNITEIDLLYKNDYGKTVSDLANECNNEKIKRVIESEVLRSLGKY